MSDTQFLTIKEAAEKYGKAEITIRRFVRGVLKAEDQKQREQIRPLPGEVEKLKKKSKPFTYSVSADLLEDQYGKDAGKTSAAKKAKINEVADEAFLELLKKTNSSLEEQLRVKDQQIKSLNQSLDDLGERQRETNVLMRGLQQQFLIGSGKSDLVESEAGSKKKRGFWPFS